MGARVELEDAGLGERADGAIAAERGCHVSTVWRRRKALGIAAAKSRATGRPPKTHWPSYAGWHKSNGQIAHELRCCVKTVSRARQRYGKAAKAEEAIAC